MELKTSSNISLAYKYEINPNLSYTMNIININQITNDQTNILNMIKYSPTDKTNLYGGFFANLKGDKRITLAGENKINEIISLLAKFNYTDENSNLYLGFKLHL